MRLFKTKKVNLLLRKSPLAFLELFNLHFINIKSISSSSKSSSPFSNIFSFSKRMAPPKSFLRFSEFFLLGFIILIGTRFNTFSERVRRLRRRQINTAMRHNSNTPTTPVMTPAMRSKFVLSSMPMSLLDSVTEINIEHCLFSMNEFVDLQRGKCHNHN